MTKRKTDSPAKPSGAAASANDDKEKVRDLLAKDMLEPSLRHGDLAASFTKALLNGTPSEKMPDLGNFYVEMLRAAQKAETGDL